MTEQENKNEMKEGIKAQSEDLQKQISNTNERRGHKEEKEKEGQTLGGERKGQK